MPTFQDSLLMSELSDWINMLQPFHQPKPEKVAIRADIECDSHSRGAVRKRNCACSTVMLCVLEVNHVSMATNPWPQIL